MSYEIITIKTGYSHLEHGIQKADGSITLLKGPQNIIVDLGTPWDKDIIIENLKVNDILIDDIDLVICTHSHSDHIGNLNLFLNAKQHIIGHEVYYKDHFFPDPFLKNDTLKIDEKISIISTPGHTSSDISVLVKNVSSFGEVIISGDIFEKAEDMADSTIWEDLSMDKDLQRFSRIKIIQMADTIIPGHGPIFKVPLNAKRNL